MRALLPAALLLLAALAGLAPAVEAQGPPASLVLKTAEPEPFSEGVPQSIPGVAELHATILTPLTHPDGVPVAYFVAEAPAWANVTISPATDVFQMRPPWKGIGAHAARDVEVTITLRDPGGRPEGEIVIEAVARPNLDDSSTVGRALISLRWNASDAPAPLDAQATDAKAVPGSSAIVVGGIAAAATGAIALRRRDE